MGMYIRKSLKVGPIRVNLSKSGVGVSAGVKGARIGVRPDGATYVHVGRGGIYYRKLFSGIIDDDVEAKIAKKVRSLLNSNRSAWFDSFATLNSESASLPVRERCASELGEFLDRINRRLVTAGFPVFTDPKLKSIANMVAKDFMLQITFPDDYAAWSPENEVVLEHAIDLAIGIIKKKRTLLGDFHNQSLADAVDVQSAFAMKHILPAVNAKHLFVDNKVFDCRFISAVSHEMLYGG